MKRVALVVPGLEQGGGVPVVAMFLHEILRGSERYEPSLISVPMSSTDAASVRLLAPSTWTRGIRRRSGTYRGEPFEHVGAFLTEVETQRYRTRAALTRLLDDHDVVQVVAGWPAWALVASDCRRPVGLQVATLVGVERQSARLSSTGARRLLHMAMTRALARMEKRAIRQVDRIFVENTWMQDHIADAAGSERVVFAPPGIDTERFTPRPRRNGDGYILSVGRLGDPRKNVALLFRAYGELLRSLPDAPKLVLAGYQGPVRSDWELATALGIRERIEFRENVSADDLVELYRGAGLYALSSNEEGLGLVILEAMACGCPVVSTDCGGPATSIVEGETGYLVPVGDHLAFAEGLRKVLADASTGARMGAAARERSHTVFSLSATGRPFLSWYDEVTGGTDAPG